MPNSRQYSRNTVKSLKASITNKNQGGGNKKSGLISSTGGRPGLSLFRAGSTQAQRESRFCINQIGGVGSGVHQTKAPADSVSSSCVTTEEREAEAEKVKLIQFPVHDPDSARISTISRAGSAKAVQATSNIPNDGEINDFVDKAHDPARLASWKTSSESSAMPKNNAAKLLSKANVKAGMKTKIKKLTRIGASSTLSAISMPLGSRLDETPDTGEAIPATAQNSQEYLAIPTNTELGATITGHRASNVSTESISLTSNELSSGHNFISETENFNQEWNLAQGDLISQASSVYVGGMESQYNSAALGQQNSFVSTLYALYDSVISEIQDAVDNPASALSIIDDAVAVGGARIRSDGTGAPTGAAGSLNLTGDTPNFLITPIGSMSELLNILVPTTDRETSTTITDSVKRVPALANKVTPTNNQDLKEAISRVYNAQSSIASLNSGVSSLNDETIGNVGSGSYVSNALTDTAKMGNNLSHRVASVNLSAPDDEQLSQSAGVRARAPGFVARQEESQKLKKDLIISINDNSKRLADEKQAQNHRQQVYSESFAQVKALSDEKTRQQPFLNTEKGKVNTKIGSIGQLTNAGGTSNFINNPVIYTPTSANITFPNGDFNVGGTSALLTKNGDYFNLPTPQYFKEKLTTHFLDAATGAAINTTNGQIQEAYELATQASSAPLGMTLAELTILQPQGLTPVTKHLVWSSYNSQINDVYNSFNQMIQALNKAITISNGINTLQIQETNQLRIIFASYGYENHQMDSNPKLKTLVQRHVADNDTQVSLTGEPYVNPPSASYATNAKNSSSSNSISHYGLSIELLATSIIVRAYGGEIVNFMMVLAEALKIGVSQVFGHVTTALQAGTDTNITFAQFKQSVVDDGFTFSNIYEQGFGTAYDIGSGQNATALTDNLFNKLFQTGNIGNKQKYSDEWNYLTTSGLYAFTSSVDAEGVTSLSMPQQLSFSYISDSVKKLFYGDNAGITEADADDILNNQIDYVELLTNYNKLSTQNGNSTGTLDVINPLHTFGSQNAVTSELSSVTNDKVNTTPSRLLGANLQGVNDAWVKDNTLNPGALTLNVFLGAAGAMNNVQFLNSANSSVKTRVDVNDLQVANYNYKVPIGTTGNLATRQLWFTNVKQILTSYVADYLGAGTAVISINNIIPTQQLNATPPNTFSKIVGAMYTYGKRATSANSSPFSNTIWDSLNHTTNADNVMYYSMRSAVLNKIYSYVDDQINSISKYLDLVQKKLKEIDAANPELVYMVTQEANTAAVYDWRPFNIQSPRYDDSKLFLQVIQLALSIDRQERILALSSRLEKHVNTIETLTKSVESKSISSKDSLKYRILISFYEKLSLQIQSQIQALQLLASQEPQYGPLQQGDVSRLTTGPNINLNTLQSNVNIPQNRLVLSLKSSGYVTVVSPSSEILKKQIDEKSSYVPNDIMRGNTINNLVTGEKHLTLAEVRPSATNSVDAKIQPDGSCRAEMADMPYPGTSTSDKINKTMIDSGSIDGTQVSIAQKVGLDNMCIQDLDLSYWSSTAIPDNVRVAIAGLKGDAQLQRTAGGVVSSVTNETEVNNLFTTKAGQESLLEAYGRKAFVGGLYVKPDFTDNTQSDNDLIDHATGNNKNIQYVSSYPSINHIKSGLNKMYQENTIKTSISLSPKYPPLNSLALAELENPLELITGIEIFGKVNNDGELFNGNVVNPSDIPTEINNVLKYVEELEGTPYEASLDNIISYFSKYVVLIKDEAPSSSFGQYIQSFFNYGLNNGIQNEHGTRVYNSANFDELSDSEGPSIFLTNIIALVTARKNDISNGINNLSGVSYESLLSSYDELRNSANFLKMSKVTIENFGALLNIQSPQSDNRTNSYQMLPVYSLDEANQSVKGPYQLANMGPVNRNLQIGSYILDGDALQVDKFISVTNPLSKFRVIGPVFLNPLKTF